MEPQGSLPVQKTRLLVLIMNHIDLFQILLPCFFEIPLKVTLPSEPVSHFFLAFCMFLSMLSQCEADHLGASWSTGEHLTFTLCECGAWMLQHACSHVSLGFMLVLCLSF